MVKKPEASPEEILADELLFDTENDITQNQLLPKKKAAKKALSVNIDET